MLMALRTSASRQTIKRASARTTSDPNTTHTPACLHLGINDASDHISKALRPSARQQTIKRPTTTPHPMIVPLRRRSATYRGQFDSRRPSSTFFFKCLCTTDTVPDRYRAVSRHLAQRRESLKSETPSLRKLIKPTKRHNLKVALRTPANQIHYEKKKSSASSRELDAP